jgi:hypothetical protein
MPDLLIFAPCQKAILANDNTISAISVMDVVRVGPIPPNTVDLPKGSLIPMSWNILTLWYGTEEDVGVTYQQRCELLAKSSDLLNDPATALGKSPVVTDFSFTQAGQRRPVIHLIFNFPVWIEGPCSLRLLIKQKDADEWVERATYPLVVEYQRAELIPSQQRATS